MNEKSYISRKEQAQLTKKKIFDTTMLLIKKKGYGKITIREICQSAQISIGTFYLYFTSKDEILWEIYDKIDQKVQFTGFDSAQHAIPAITQNFLTYLTNMTSMFEKELLREIYRNTLISGENHFLCQERPLYQSILSCLDILKNEKRLITDISPDQLCYRLHMFVQSYIYQWLVDDNLDSKFLTDECMQELSYFLTLYVKK